MPIIILSKVNAAYKQLMELNDRELQELMAYKRVKVRLFKALRDDELFWHHEDEPFLDKTSSEEVLKEA